MELGFYSTNPPNLLHQEMSGNMAWAFSAQGAARKYRKRRDYRRGVANTTGATVLEVGFFSTNPSNLLQQEMSGNMAWASLAQGAARN